ncbi:MULTISPECIES: hypothetical protein [Methylobacteriaceae]|uniref:hypothetical protein n=1 Tax=Methylobacteriaceae TaxID=119045 RepID=UPI00074F9214|nr:MULTISPECIES: hypothetical protein [Methylobacteriaceae]AMB43466.1 hypothetical protein Y590_01045 [Methylobacterium sp. AMS5]
MRPSTVFAAASLCLAALPCRAQGVPPNPFASNYPSSYPSAPPRMVEREGRLQAPRARRPLPPGRIERGLLPPADVPGR